MSADPIRPDPVEIDDIDDLLIDIICVGLPKDCAFVGGSLISPSRKKTMTEDRSKDYDKVKARLTALLRDSNRRSRIDEAKAFEVELAQHEKRLELYDLDNVVLDALVASGEATKEQRAKRDDMVSERRACFIARHIIKLRLQRLEAGLEEA